MPGTGEEEMGLHNDFGRLESIIEQLLASFAELKKEKALLEKNLQSKEKEINDLREQLSTLEKEKSQVHFRVSSLITTIETWEKENMLDTEQSESDDSIEKEAAAKENHNPLLSLSG